MLCNPNKCRSPFAKRCGFTLVELLTVIAIVGILIAITVPTVGRIRESSKRTKCLSNLRQLKLAADLYANDNKAAYPPAYDGEAWWYVHLVPYVVGGRETVALITNDPNSIFRCPSNTKGALSAATDPYGMNVQLPSATSITPATRNAAAIRQIERPSQAMFLIDCKNSWIQYNQFDERIGTESWRHEGKYSAVFSTAIPLRSQRIRFPRLKKMSFGPESDLEDEPPAF